MTWMVTGGAGYIGAHVAQALCRAGERVVALDDLSTGSPDRLDADVPLVVADVADVAAVSRALAGHAVTGVVHLAAKKAVEESVAQPLRYYRENVGGLVSLLEAGVAGGLRHVVFSSSAAVYGTPDTERVDEDSPTRPESPYGQTKLAGEWLVAATAHAHGLGWAALRYFNVVGAAAPRLADTGVHNLVPRVFQALSAGARPQVYGGDYPTRDGSCIRDYIDVVDLAGAHVDAAQALAAGRDVGVLNIGRGEGVTVKEVIAEVERVTGRAVPYDVVGRRPGDPAQVVALAQRAEAVLGWRARRGLPEMVAGAWEAWQHRRG